MDRAAGGRGGIARRSRAVEAKANIETLLQLFEVLPLPSAAASHYGAIRAHLEKIGTPIGGNDLWLAAHALSSNLTLVTDNQREFQRVPGLSGELGSRS